MCILWHMLAEHMPMAVPSIEVVLPFVVIPKARPRVTKDVTYMPPRYVHCRSAIAMLLANAKRSYEGCLPLQWSKALSYSIVVRVWVNKSTEGDVDSLLGTVMDAGNGILWIDDRQVVKATTEKHIREKDGCVRRAEVEVFPLEQTGFEPKFARKRAKPSAPTNTAGARRGTPTVTIEEYRNMLQASRTKKGKCPPRSG